MKIKVKENQNLDEMARQSISHPTDDLPFRVVINAPDHSPPHAHLMDRKTGQKEIGQFLIPASKPKSSADIQNYKQGIPDDIRNTLFLWMRGKSKFISGKTNWEFLCAVWRQNEATKMKW
jgi:hypothetical protein